jgi:hypothetical protein
VLSYADQSWPLAYGIQDARLRTLDFPGSNVETGPVEKSGILFWSQSNNPHLGIASKQEAALSGMFFWSVERKNHNIRSHLLDRFVEITIVPYFADNLDVRLIGDGSHDEFPH